MPRRASPAPRPLAKSSQGLSWLIGAAILFAVVFVAVHRSEGHEFAALLERANPWWLAVALALQAATYLAQAEVLGAAPQAAGVTLPRGWLYRLALSKVFLDQALPSAGISSTVVVARALSQQAVPRGAVAAGAMINIASYHAAYVVMLVIALATTRALWRGNLFVLLVSFLFIVFAIGLTTAVLTLPGRRTVAVARTIRLRVVRRLLAFVQDADPALTRNSRLLATTSAWQAGIVLLDAATMWVLIRSLGGTAPASVVFASFMVSSVFRTMGVVPGGLGTYEATSILTLHLSGLSIPLALSSTLIFRGLTFWLPMIPGLWFSRGLTNAAAPGQRQIVREPYWATDAGIVAAQLGSGPGGLSQTEADARLASAGGNSLRGRVTAPRARLLAAQLRSPLLLILVFAAVASAIGGAWTDAGIVLIIVGGTVGITYSREFTAQALVAALQARVRTTASVVRDGQTVPVPMGDVVPGDVVLLSAGSLVPGDGVLLDATDCFISESVLTGESFPVQKTPGIVPASAPVRERTNSVFLGTNVRSGAARCLITTTGAATELGAVADRLRVRRPDTEFDRGLRRFGYLLTTAMLTLVLLVFVGHMLRGRPPLETLLFSVALAVGLSPELLPAILSVNLARGAQMMARRGVIVRHLNAIENLGSMTILCTDKTGTLTEGVVELEGAYDGSGARSSEVLRLGSVNAALESGLSNPLDDAIVKVQRPDLSCVRKLAEMPFDFTRKRVSVIVEDDGVIRLVTKGAFDRVLPACTQAADGQPLDAPARARLQAQYETWTRQGIRVLAVAVRTLERKPVYDRDDERDLQFAGFLTFLDRPKSGVAATIRDLAGLGVSVKLITGDSQLVARHVAGLVGLRAACVLTGRDVLGLSDEALWQVVQRTDLFVEVDPNQKERIILALKRMGDVVGFLGDGVNDAPAMHAADVSLSVQHAVDVAREAADFVLLEQDLDVIRRGIEEGRKTFANTLKYLLITTSANLGNMVSMAAASLYLPFLPLLAGQILLNNFLSDIPAIGIADDSVDADMIRRPERWNVRWIGAFMIYFGLLSSAFDLFTFTMLLGWFHAAPEVFRTGWFVESLLTELVVVFVLRTRGPFYRSRPGRLLLASTVALILVTVAIPYVPLVGLLGFVPLPGVLLATLCAITVTYVLATEGAKRLFFGAPAH